MVTSDPTATGLSTPYDAPGWAQAMRRITDYLVIDFLGGPRPWKLAWIINFQKAGTFVFLLALIAWYGNTSTAAWVYTAMQGSYGLVWILKDTAFPDPNWQRRVTIGGGINAFMGVLGWYWVFGWLLVSGVSQPDYPLWRDHDLRQFCDDGLALAARPGSRMGLVRAVRRQHDHERSQYVALSRMGRVQEADLVADSVCALVIWGRTLRAIKVIAPGLCYFCSSSRTRFASCS
jgi:hypothetical protein